MLAGLLERLERSVTLVVGKGGVGKTTTAGGVALALAERGDAVHLVSTDPAHSLGDLFDQTLRGGAAPARCSDRVTIEELDGVGHARTRLKRLEPALRELIDRGTYLDTQDAESLLAAAVPGLDEVGGALRLAEIAAAGGRVVVDTAPTGHMLRLLDTPATIRGWVRVFRAMAAKADAVASALVGAGVRMSGERELDELADEMDTFERVIRDADFVVVTAPGAAVEAETARLVEALTARGLRITATVAADRPGARADLLLPLRPGLRGCDALRDWAIGGAASTAAPPESPPGSAEASPGPEPGAERAAEPDGEPGDAPVVAGSADGAPWLRELVVFAGKGGVGKSTCAAAAAVRLAADGPVLLLGADPAPSLSDVLRGEEVPGLTVRDLDAGGELERWKAVYRDEVEEVFEAVGLERSARMDREVIESLWELAPPGIDELMAVSRLAEGAQPGTRIVLDTAPTGHFLRLVAMPELALDWTHRIMRILLKYRALGDLDAPAQHLIRFSRRFRALRERLADSSRTALVLVTLDEPLVRAETRRLIERLRAMGLPPAAVLVNRAAGAVRPGAHVGEVETWRAPEVPEPYGARGLAAFADRWERVA